MASLKAACDRAVAATTVSRRPLHEHAVRAAGLLLGLLASFAATSLWPVSLGPLDELKQSGIVSPGTLQNYPKYRETIHYLLWLGVTIAVAAAFWVAWALLASRPGHTRGDGSSAAAPPAASVPAETRRAAVTPLEMALLAIVLLLLTVTPAIFFDSRAGWVFVQDQGMHLSWANSILQGKALYRDSYVLYGPLMEYPLALAMYLFGASVLVLRVYNFALNMVALVALAFLLRYALRHRLLAYAATLLLVVVYFPLFPGMQSAIFRTTPAVMAVFLAWVAREKNSYVLMGGAGMAAAFALFYSQETGMAALIALAAMHAADIVSGSGAQKPGKRIGASLGGVLVVATPVLAFLAAQGALGAYLWNVFSLGSLRLTGYPGIPYPSLADGFQTSLARISASLASGVFPPRGFGNLAMAAVYYLPVLLYMAVGLDLVVRFLQRRFDGRDMLKLGFLALSAASFPYVLSLAATWAIVNVFPPSIILALIYVEERPTWSVSLPLKVLQSAAVALFAVGLALHSTGSGLFFDQLALKALLLTGSAVPAEAWHTPDNVPLTLPRAQGMRVPPATHRALESVVRFVQERTRPNEPIFVFTYAPIYYFLTDRPNSTRYDFFLVPNTRADREQVVAQLEKDQTRIVVRDGGHLWGVPAEVMEPEIARYLDQHYIEVLSVEGARVLERKGK